MLVTRRWISWRPMKGPTFGWFASVSSALVRLAAGSDGDCAAMERCDGDRCVPFVCASDEACPGGWRCLADRCVPPFLCFADTDCPTGAIATGGNIRAGGSIDAFGLLCGTPSVAAF